MEKLIARTPLLITKAMAGDPVAIALLAAAGLYAGYKCITEKKQG